LLIDAFLTGSRCLPAEVFGLFCNCTEVALFIAVGPKPSLKTYFHNCKHHSITSRHLSFFQLKSDECRCQQDEVIKVNETFDLLCMLTMKVNYPALLQVKEPMNSIKRSRYGSIPLQLYFLLMLSRLHPRI